MASASSQIKDDSEGGVLAHVLAQQRDVLAVVQRAQEQQKLVLETNAAVTSELIRERQAHVATREECNAQVNIQRENASKEREARLRDQIEYKKQMSEAQEKLTEEKLAHKKTLDAYTVEQSASAANKTKVAEALAVASETASAMQFAANSGKRKRDIKVAEAAASKVKEMISNSGVTVAEQSPRPVSGASGASSGSGAPRPNARINYRPCKTLTAFIKGPRCPQRSKVAQYKKYTEFVANAFSKRPVDNKFAYNAIDQGEWEIIMSLLLVHVSADRKTCWDGGVLYVPEEIKTVEDEVRNALTEAQTAKRKQEEDQGMTTGLTQVATRDKHPRYFVRYYMLRDHLLAEDIINVRNNKPTVGIVNPRFNIGMPPVLVELKERHAETVPLGRPLPAYASHSSQSPAAANAPDAPDAPDASNDSNNGPNANNAPIDAANKMAVDV